MPRYVLLYPKTTAPREELELIENDPEVTVLDNTMGRALLVEVDDAVAKRLREQLSGWVIGEEQEHPKPELKRPTTRKNGAE